MCLEIASSAITVARVNTPKITNRVKSDTKMLQLQMLLFPNALCCSLYDRNCVYAVTKIFTKILPANNFCQLLRVTRKRSCTSAGQFARAVALSE